MLNLYDHLKERHFDINRYNGVMGFDDWILKGVHGEFYPIKPDILVKTYERV